MKYPKNLANDSGVYAIINRYNDKKYIGGTQSGFKQRLEYHLQDLIENRHPNEYFQRAYNIDPSSFEFVVLEVCENPWEREQHYLDNENWDILYNLSRFATVPKYFKKGHTPWNKGKKMSKEHCEKLSESAKNRVITEEGKSKRSEAFREQTNNVLVYNLEEELLGEHRSVPDLCELDPNPYKNEMKIRNKNGRNGYDPYSLHEQSIRAVCGGFKESYKGLIFKYKSL